MTDAKPNPRTALDVATVGLPTWLGVLVPALALAIGGAVSVVSGELGATYSVCFVAAAILAAVQGGLMLSQPERSSWPLEAALDSLLDVLKAGAPASNAP